MTPALTIDELRLQAKKCLPKPIFDFFDGAAFTEATKNANEQDFGKIRLRQRVLRDVTNRDHSTSILGQKSSLPTMISPVGMSGLLAPFEAEAASARAAKVCGIPFGLSMLSFAPMEEISRQSGYPFWFHAQPLKDRGLLQSLLDRATALGSPVLIMTVDWITPTQNHRNVRNKLGQHSIRGAFEFATHPRWVRAMAKSKRKFEPGNFAGRGFGDPNVLIEALDVGATFEYIEWVRKIWPGKILVKGIMDAGDAKAAFKAGADGISISNHGGLQLDHAQSAIAALAEITHQVGDMGEILIDSGVRTGHDVVKALALGARACLLGRPYLYGLAIGGQSGVEHAVRIIRGELDSAMALSGCRAIADIDRNSLVPMDKVYPSF